MSIDDISRLVSEGKTNIQEVPVPGLVAVLPEIDVRRARAAISQALAHLLSVRDRSDAVSEMTERAEDGAGRAVTLFVEAGRGTTSANAVDMISGAQIMQETAGRLGGHALRITGIVDEMTAKLQEVMALCDAHEEHQQTLVEGIDQLAGLQPTVAKAANEYLHNIRGSNGTL